MPVAAGLLAVAGLGALWLVASWLLRRRPRLAGAALSAGARHGAADEEITLRLRARKDEQASEPWESRADFEAAPKELPSSSRVKVIYEDEAEEEEVTSPLARILISATGDSDRGKVRRANEDALLFVPERSLFAVADGMGGYHGGQVASALAVEALRQTFEREAFGGELRSDTAIPRRGRELASAMLHANCAVFEAAQRQPEYARMGTTLIAARFSPNKQRLYLGHVGDSRCYRWRGGALRQLTTDHTMRLIGLRGPGSNELLQAIGVTAELAIDLIVDKPRADDVYLLCSDGLPKMLSHEEIARVLLDEPDLEAAVYGLIGRANDRGGRDNVTVILIKVIERAIRPSLAAARALAFSSRKQTPAPQTAGNADQDDVTLLRVRRPR